MSARSGLVGNKSSWPHLEPIFHGLENTKNALNGMKWGQEDLFPTNPDLPDILGDTDFDFEKFHFWDCFGSQISRFPGSRFPHFQKSGQGQAWAGLGLGQAWALGRRAPRLGRGPSGKPGGPRVGPLPPPSLPCLSPSSVA